MSTDTTLTDAPGTGGIEATEQLSGTTDFAAMLAKTEALFDKAQEQNFLMQELELKEGIELKWAQMRINPK